jgi:alkylation response protein AidB-like acyl-CoA dehydrogenase
MDYRDTPEEADFRARLRAWLADNVPTGWRDIHDHAEHDRMYRAWHRALYAAGYMGMSWPKEYGGQDLSPVYEAILNDETGNADAPPVPSVGYMGRAIFTYGSEEQKKRFLPPLLNGEVRWCQGFSEPEAGSDLASLRTRGELHGDHYVVNGQKMWSSGGIYSDWCMLLVRTNHEVPQHQGITCLLASMHSPGVEARPIVLANGNPETAEVFWDGVEVPAENRLGNEGDGWRIAMTTVSYERGPGDVGTVAHFRRNLRQIERMAAARGRVGDRQVREALARAYVYGEAQRLNVAEQLSKRVSGHLPGPDASVSKQLWTQAEQYLQHVAMDLAGADGLTGADPDRLVEYFMSRPISVYGGSAQIQRNLLAQRVLGLPRS